MEGENPVLTTICGSLLVSPDLQQTYSKTQSHTAELTPLIRPCIFGRNAPRKEGLPIEDIDLSMSSIGSPPFWLCCQSAVQVSKNKRNCLKQRLGLIRQTFRRSHFSTEFNSDRKIIQYPTESLHHT